MTRFGGLFITVSAAVLLSGLAPDSLQLPVSTAAAHGIPAGSCRTSPIRYFQYGTRLCMTAIQRDPLTFQEAMQRCMEAYGRVADYHDWAYRETSGDHIHPPWGVPPSQGIWLGPLTGDNRALFANDPRPDDFEGETSKFEKRRYACAHDRS